MMIYMLAFAVIWEAFCGWLEKHTEENKANSEMVSKVGRELIILGFIAFAVILMHEPRMVNTTLRDSDGTLVSYSSGQPLYSCSRTPIIRVYWDSLSPKIRRVLLVLLGTVLYDSVPSEAPDGQCNPCIHAPGHPIIRDTLV